MLFLDIELEQNNTRKQKVGHCDKNHATDFFHFYSSENLCFIDIPCNFSQKYPVVLGKKFILLFLLFFRNCGHLGFLTSLYFTILRP